MTMNELKLEVERRYMDALARAKHDVTEKNSLYWLNLGESQAWGVIYELFKHITLTDSEASEKHQP